MPAPARLIDGALGRDSAAGGGGMTGERRTLTSACSSALDTSKRSASSPRRSSAASMVPLRSASNRSKTSSRWRARPDRMASCGRAGRAIRRLVAAARSGPQHLHDVADASRDLGEQGHVELAGAVPRVRAPRVAAGRVAGVGVAGVGARRSGVSRQVWRCRQELSPGGKQPRELDRPRARVGERANELVHGLGRERVARASAREDAVDLSRRSEPVAAPVAPHQLVFGRAYIIRVPPCQIVCSVSTQRVGRGARAACWLRGQRVQQPATRHARPAAVR